VTTDAERVAAARRWFKRRGYASIERDGVTLVATPSHPDTWEANWACADRGVGAESLLAAMDLHLGHTPWRVAQVDALTDPAVEAALALADFRAESTLIEMIAREVVAPQPVPEITLREVGPGDWEALTALVEVDLREGKRTGEHDQGVAAGLLDGMRRRLGSCSYWLLVKGATPVGYGMTALCPNGLGLIENLFTLPEHRGRGLMSGFIVEAARRLYVAGCDAVFLDAHAHDTPKRLYARLGFAPIAVTRTWVKRV
jgi:predicted GNAT family acetyltransferase